MNTFLKRAAVAAAASALVAAPALAANATPWDGNDIEFTNTAWDVDYSYFGIQDIDLMPNNVYTDIWDGAGNPIISFDNWDTDTWLVTDSSDSMDVTVDDNGDTVITATATNTELADNNLTADVEMRIYAEEDLWRQAVTYTNNGTDDITVDLGFYTDWGSNDTTSSGGGVRGYQGSSDSILALPADEDGVTTTALADAGVKWAVHGDSCDAPGAMAWGDASAQTDAQIYSIDGDQWYVHADDVTIPAGESVTVVVFHNWDPTGLIAANYDNDACDAGAQADYADAVTALSTEFDSFSGRLSRGLENANVINWTGTPSTPTAEPTLATTGFDASAATAAGAAALASIAAASLLIARRRKA